MNFYPFHIGDYISHTSHLTDEEDLAYRRMIDLYYQTEVPFKDELFVARRVRTTQAIARVLLDEYFELQEDGWHNKRADEEIAKYKAMKEGGKKGTPTCSSESHFMVEYKNNLTLLRQGFTGFRKVLHCTVTFT